MLYVLSTVVCPYYVQYTRCHLVMNAMRIDDQVGQLCALHVRSAENSGVTGSGEVCSMPF